VVIDLYPSRFHPNFKYPPTPCADCVSLAIFKWILLPTFCPLANLSPLAEAILCLDRGSILTSSWLFECNMLGGVSDFWLFYCILGRVSEFCLWVLFIFLFPSYKLKTYFDFVQVN